MKNLKFTVSVILLIIYTLTTDKSFAQSATAAHNYLTGKAGKWTVVMTLTPDAKAPAQVIKGLTAERVMIGDYCLHETMHPAAGAKVPDFKRLADLAYNLNELRWDYISVDTRITAGIMYFTYQGSTANTITSFLTSFPNPGMGQAKKGRGQALYARNVVVKINNDHDQVKQYWRLTDQPEWLAIQYDYTRNH